MSDTDSTPVEESAGEAEAVAAPAPEPTEAPEAPAEPQDLDDVINSAIEESFKPDEPDGPARDEHGRFVSAHPQEEADSEAPESAPDEASGEGDDQETEAETETEEVPPLDAPVHWSAEDKERFSSMPREAQEWAIERDKAMTADYTRKTQEIAQVRQRLEPVARTLEPLRPSLQRAGVSEGEYVSKLVDADRMLQTDPVQAIQYLAQQAGVDLATLEPGEQQFVDPQFAALESKINHLESTLTQREQYEQQARMQEANGQIEAFRSQTDDAGNPKYPHFDAVRVTMGKLVEDGTAASMEDAYNKAVRLDDNLFQQTLEAERLKAKQAEDAKRKAAVEKAKGVQPKSGRVPSTGVVQSDDLDSLLSQSLDRAGIR